MCNIRGCSQIDDVDGRQYTYSQLVEHVHNCARSLRELGLELEQRVCLLLPNCTELPVAFLAILRVGAICVPFNPAATKCNANDTHAKNRRRKPVLPENRQVPVFGASDM